MKKVYLKIIHDFNNIIKDTFQKINNIIMIKYYYNLKKMKKKIQLVLFKNRNDKL